MADTFLAHDSLDDFVTGLLKIGTLNGPTFNDLGVLSFNPVTSLAALRLDYQRTLLPAKKYLFPPHTKTLHFDPVSGYSQAKTAGETVILFGLHPCDLAAIAYLDRVFLEVCPDPLYESRRNRLVLVGISCEPDEYCFCGELDTASVPFDIFLSRQVGGFDVLTASGRGEEIISGLAMLLAKGGNGRKACGIAETLGRIHHAVERRAMFADSPLWDDFAGRCLSCGACSLCCPTCYCLDVREYGALDGQAAERIQEWDNCLFKAHGEIAGGVNFRKTRQERFRYRFLHKYYGFGALRGVVSCVGCGRCREVCPVRIDLLDLFREKDASLQPGEKP